LFIGFVGNNVFFNYELASSVINRSQQTIVYPEDDLIVAGIDREFTEGGFLRNITGGGTGHEIRLLQSSNKNISPSKGNINPENAEVRNFVAMNEVSPVCSPTSPSEFPYVENIQNAQGRKDTFYNNCSVIKEEDETMFKMKNPRGFPMGPINAGPPKIYVGVDQKITSKKDLVSWNKARFLYTGSSELLREFSGADRDRYHGEPYDSIPEEVRRQIFHPCLRENRRISLMKVLLHSIPSGMTKARIAFALALSYSSINQLRSDPEAVKMCESLYFEAVINEDIMERNHTFIPAILSEFGYTCLVRYADMCIANDKYLYALESLKNANECLLFHGFNSISTQLSLYIGQISLSNEDYETSLTCYRTVALDFLRKLESVKRHEILERQKIHQSSSLGEYSELNQFVHAMRVVVEIYRRCGNFERAAELLVDTICVYEEYSKLGSKKLAMQVDLACAVVKSGRISSGLEILDKVKFAILFMFSYT
jgi:tetratricopeptide (TPR) repeat protein